MSSFVPPYSSAGPAFVAARKAAEDFIRAMKEVARLLPSELPDGTEVSIGSYQEVYRYNLVVRGGTLLEEYRDGGSRQPWLTGADDAAREVTGGDPDTAVTLKVEAAAQLAAALVPVFTNVIAPKK
jgi:hypothetical protein